MICAQCDHPQEHHRDNGGPCLLPGCKCVGFMWHKPPTETVAAHLKHKALLDTAEACMSKAQNTASDDMRLSNAMLGLAWVQLYRARVEADSAG